MLNGIILGRCKLFQGWLQIRTRGKRHKWISILGTTDASWNVWLEWVWGLGPCLGQWDGAWVRLCPNIFSLVWSGKKKSHQMFKKVVWMLERQINFRQNINTKYFKKQQIFQLIILLSSTGSFISIEIHRLLMPQRYFKYDYNLHGNWKLISNYYLLTKWLIWKITKEERLL